MENNQKQSLDELLNRKKDSQSEGKTVDAKDDLKERMKKVIAASKKLDNEGLSDDTKKAIMKEKLANASKQYEEFEENNIDDSYDDLSDTLASEYAEKNAAMKAKLLEMEKMLDSIDDNFSSSDEEQIEKVEENENSELVITETEKMNEDDLASHIVNDIVKEHREEVKEQVVEEEKVYVNTFWKKFGMFFLNSAKGLAVSTFLTIVIGIGSFLLGDYLNGLTENAIISLLGQYLIDFSAFAFNCIAPAMAIAIACYEGLKKEQVLAIGLSGCAFVFFIQNQTEEFSVGYDIITAYLIIMINVLLVKVLIKKERLVFKLLLPLLSCALTFAICNLLYEPFSNAFVYLYHNSLYDIQSAYFNLIIALAVEIAMLVLYIVRWAKNKKNCK